MREYGIIHAGFWRDTGLQAATDGARLLACYLLTSSHGNGLGCFYLSSGYIGADLGWNAQRVSKGFDSLRAARFAVRCPATEFVLVRSYLRWNPVANPNIAKHREKQYRAVPEGFRYRAALALELLTFGRYLRETFLDTLRQTVEDADADSAKPFRNTDTDTDTEKDKKDLKHLSGARTRQAANGEEYRPVCTLRTAQGSAYVVREDQAGIWQGQFPGVDVERELSKASAWLDANPTRRKTERGMPRFLVNWLSRAQDSGRGAAR